MVMFLRVLCVFGVLGAAYGVWLIGSHAEEPGGATAEMTLCVANAKTKLIAPDKVEFCSLAFAANSKVHKLENGYDAKLGIIPVNKTSMRELHQTLVANGKKGLPDFESWWDHLPVGQQ